MNVKTSFATRLKALRERQELNQGQLARELGISRGSISFYENGDRIPDIETFDMICDFFNVSYDYLLGKSDLEENNIEVKAIREYTHLTDENIKRLHIFNEEYLFDVLNSFIAQLLQKKDYLIKVEEFLFYSQLIQHAHDIFNMDFLNKYNLPYKDDELIYAALVWGKLDSSKKENMAKIEYAYGLQTLETELHEICDKADLLEFKLSKGILEEIIGEIDNAFSERLEKKIDTYSLSDILSNNFKSLYEEEFENYKAKQARKYGCNSEK